MSKTFKAPGILNQPPVSALAAVTALSIAFLQKIWKKWK